MRFFFTDIAFFFIGQPPRIISSQRLRRKFVVFCQGLFENSFVFVTEKEPGIFSDTRLFFSDSYLTDIALGGAPFYLLWPFVFFWHLTQRCDMIFYR
jgi:hypothetical protein